MRAAMRIFLAVFLINHKNLSSSTKLTIMATELTYNPEYVEDHRIVIHPDKLGLDSYLNLARDFPLDPWVKVSINLKNRKTERYREVFCTDNNVCQILGKGDKGFMTIWVENIVKISNLPKDCPFPKGHYTFLNLTTENVKIPKFLAGIYKVNVATYFRRKAAKEMVANLTITGQLK